jgi:hypothetical protein
MNGADIRIRRLSRLAARARAEVAAAERHLAQAAREAAAAADRAASLATIISETRPSPGSGGLDALLAGAHLRQLLRPAVAAAAAAQRASAGGQAAAGQRLTKASARADGLDDRLDALRRRVGTATERRIADLTPDARRRK